MSSVFDIEDLYDPEYDDFEPTIERSDDFIWKAKDGSKKKYYELDTSHIKNILKGDWRVDDRDILRLELYLRERRWKDESILEENRFT